MKPITPKEAIGKKDSNLEPEIIQAVNELIIQKLDSYGEATVKQKDIVAKYFELKGISDTVTNSKRLHDNHQLDIESTYKKAGWNVNYEKPTYGDTDFDPYFTFKRLLILIG